MSREKLLHNYPNIMAILDDWIDDKRFLVVIDPNLEEEADEADVFDPTEYNWMIFFPERVGEALGDSLFKRLKDEVSKIEIFKEFFADDDDLFGVWSEAEEDEISDRVLKVLDSLAEDLNLNRDSRNGDESGGV
jgi:hypothetical protein